jgi:hypothetical protein
VEEMRSAEAFDEPKEKTAAQRACGLVSGFDEFQRQYWHLLSALVVQICSAGSFLMTL